MSDLHVQGLRFKVQGSRFRFGPSGSSSVPPAFASKASFLVFVLVVVLILVLERVS
jgi:hypothetical protein